MPCDALAPTLCPWCCNVRLLEAEVSATQFSQCVSGRTYGNHCKQLWWCCYSARSCAWSLMKVVCQSHCICWQCPAVATSEWWNESADVVTETCCKWMLFVVSEWLIDVWDRICCWLDQKPVELFIYILLTLGVLVIYWSLITSLETWLFKMLSMVLKLQPGIFALCCLSVYSKISLQLLIILNVLLFKYIFLVSHNQKYHFVDGCLLVFVVMWLSFVI